MKFQYKIQDYQTDAVHAVVGVFDGQPKQEKTRYRRDIGITSSIEQQATMVLNSDEDDFDLLDETGYRNEPIALSDQEILENIRGIQAQQNIKQSSKLSNAKGRVELDVEMETGTGKTYVYIKTMFELNKKYGWSKFIVVVPSIAIREGVKKTFETTADHFMEQYGKKARFFVYDSKNLNQLDNFSQSSGINVMIINAQAFNTSLKEGGRSKESRIIYTKRDEFASRRPIDVLKANNPIIIIDEPQKLGGEKTQAGIKNFNPLFTINYSATHKQAHNSVYALDALDAYNERLVKQIEVKGFKVKNFRGTDGYLYLEDILLDPKKPPRAKIEFEIGYKKSINRETRILDVNDNLYFESKEMEQYRGYTISEIDPINEEVTFTNGVVLKIGEALGDISEEDMRRIQIRETILSHFDKEKDLFNRGIKTLSLFFIDEVAKYRQYDDNGQELAGQYAKIFEEEYQTILKDVLDSEPDGDYKKYLESTCSDVSRVHQGYFSIDKKTGRVKDDYSTKKSDYSDDISAYDLILKNKERLLSFEEPTRFIFSHSALREGWDNPNVFQLCTLKHSENEIAKRQEVGRGLRLSVNQDGNRMDVETLGNEVFDVNTLTVIASESYESFVEGLQRNIKSELRDRPKKITDEFFRNNFIFVNGERRSIDKKTADDIEYYLISNQYLDQNREVSDKYRMDVETDSLAELPDDLKPIAAGIHTLIQSVYDEKALERMFKDANTTKVKENPLNENFYKKEFQELWKRINHKYTYRVEFDSEELIRKAIRAIDDQLFIAPLQYTRTVGRQKESINQYEIEHKSSFVNEASGMYTLRSTPITGVPYDLIGKIAQGATLTRRTAAQILKGIKPEKFSMFKINPEKFISEVIRLVSEQKATMIVEHISYNQIEGEYDSSIFTAERTSQSYDKAFEAKKAIQNYVFTDGYAKDNKSIERTFVEDLDLADEVAVYAKLPKAFHIPTPVGNYSPDWAIAFKKGEVKHIFFIAETKGTMNSMQLKEVESAKIKCAEKLFNEISTENVKYHKVDKYENLLKIVSGL